MLTSEQKQSFDRNGYLVVEGIVAEGLISAMKNEARLLGERDAGRAAWNERALFRRQPFRQILDVSALVEAASDLLGDDIQLLALDLRVVPAGHGSVEWHRDIDVICNKTLAVNTGIYLQDTDEKIGPLRVIPGSHRWERSPDNPGADPMLGEVLLPVPAGAAVFHEAGVWHTASPNRSGADCWAVFPFFGRYWIKRMGGHFTQPLPADLLHTADPMKRQLLGLELRATAPNFLGDSASYNLRGDPGVDFPLDAVEGAVKWT